MPRHSARGIDLPRVVYGHAKSSAPLSAEFAAAIDAVASAMMIATSRS